MRYNMCSLSINEFLSKLSTIQSKSVTTVKEADETKAELKDLLFSEEVYNSSSLDNDELQAQIDTLEIQISDLEKQIANKEEAAEKELKNITENNKKVAEKQNSLEEAIADAISETQEANEEAQNDLKNKISEAQQNVINRYLNGNLDVDPEHPETGIASAIEAELSGVAGSVSPDLSSARQSFAKADNITREITSLLHIISTQSNVLNALKSDITSLKSQVSVLKLTKSTYEQMKDANKSTSTNTNTLNLSSLFSSSKSEFLNELKESLNIPVKATNAETGVAAADADNKNEQLIAMGSAIDVDGENSIVKQMADKGLSFEEASKALAWLFDDSGIGFDSESGAMIIPNGDDNEAESIYSSLADQMKEYWGSNANIDRTSDLGINQQSLSATSATIGFHLTGANDNDFSYNFVVDYNNDGIFNGENEFLGADKDISQFANQEALSDDDKQAIRDMFGDKISFALWGDNLENLSGSSLKAFDLNNDGKINKMESLFMLDLNKDGSITGRELDNMMVLETNEKTKGSAFMSATSAGISNINLSDYMKDGQYSNDLVSSTNATDINGNIKQNKFGLTVHGNNITGSQNLNSTEYNNTMYSELYNDNYKLEFDENIFNQIVEETATEEYAYVDYTLNAVEALTITDADKIDAKTQQRSLINEANNTRNRNIETAKAGSYSLAKSVAQPVKEEPVEGDINGDGKITIEDGDYNEDGVVNYLDEEFLRKLQEAEKQEEEQQ